MSSTPGAAPPRPAPASGAARLAPLFAGGAILGIASFLVCEVYDLDVFWNVVIGKDILATRSVPTVDRYTAAGLGHSYVDIHWLFQVAVGAAHHAAGWAGVELVQVLVWGLALWLSYRATSRWASPGSAAILVFLAAMASIERFLPRPEIITVLMIALFYDRLRAESGPTPRTLVALGLAQAVWTNAHGLFVLGPFMAGACLLDALLRRRDGTGPAWFRLVGVLLLATLATPHGLGAWGYAWLLVTQVGPGASQLMKSLGELSPTFGPAFRTSPAFWFFLVLLGMAAAATVRAIRSGTWSLARVLIAGALGATALTGRRNVVLFAIVAAPFIAEHGAQAIRALEARLGRGLLIAPLLMTAWAAYPVSGRFFLDMELPTRFGLGVTPSFFPHALPRFLDAIGFRGQVYNSNTIGGFYLFHSFPARLPLTEGRWTAYDDGVVTRILQAPGSKALWRWVEETYRIRALLLHHTSPEAAALLPRLPRDPEWRLVYLDHAASFWLREPGPQTPAPIDLSGPLKLARPRRIDDCLMLDAFLAAVGARAARIENLEQAASFGYRREALLSRLGRLQAEEGRLGDAETTFTSMSREFPRNADGPGELAYFAFLRGDLGRAERLLLTALELRPGDADLEANLLRVRAARGAPAPRR